MKSRLRRVGQGGCGGLGAAVDALADAAPAPDPAAIGMDVAGRVVVDDPPAHDREAPGGALRREQRRERRLRHQAVGVQHPEELDLRPRRQCCEAEIDRPGIAEIARGPDHRQRRQRRRRRRRRGRGSRPGAGPAARRRAASPAAAPAPARPRPRRRAARRCRRARHCRPPPPGARRARRPRTGCRRIRRSRRRS